MRHPSFLHKSIDMAFPYLFRIESEVKSQMQKIEFYCKFCKKSMKMAYEPVGVDDTQVMNGVIIRCHTHKCTRVVVLKKYTEGVIIKMTDSRGKCYL